MRDLLEEHAFSLSGQQHLSETIPFIHQQEIDEIKQEISGKSMTGEKLARVIISTLSTSYGIESNRLVASMRDRASVNTVGGNGHTKASVSIFARCWVFFTHLGPSWRAFQSSCCR